MIDELKCLKVSRDAALAAGKVLLENFKKLKKIDSDIGRDLKLELDLKSEIIIKNTLNESFSFPFLAEESDNSKLDQTGYYWVIDPLDGTYNYFRGIPVCAISIALWKSDEPVLGVIYDFINDQMISGAIGKGAYLNNEKIELHEQNSIENSALATGLPVNRKVDLDSFQTFNKVISSFKKVRMLGSATASLSYVITGKVDCYWEESIMLWDVAAGLAILKSMNAFISIEQASIMFSCNIIASNNEQIVTFIQKGSHV